jgi:hypothetical protein
MVSEGRSDPDGKRNAQVRTRGTVKSDGRSHDCGPQDHAPYCFPISKTDSKDRGTNLPGLSAELLLYVRQLRGYSGFGNNVYSRCH